jgi:hypothetical protein
VTTPRPQIFSGTPNQQHYTIWRRLFLSLTLALGGVVAAMLLAEGALRIAGFSYLGFLYRSDPDLGWTLRPNLHGQLRNEGGRVVFETNRAGLRDVEHATAKPSGVLRIAVLGDSFTEAKSLPLKQTFWWIMQEQLQHCPALAQRHVEAINFGVSAYGPAQELIMLQKRVWAYAPDVVLLAFYPGNDVTDSSPLLNGGRSRPYFSLRDGRLVADNSFRHSALYIAREQRAYRFYVALSSHLRVLQLIDYARDVFHGGRIWSRITGALASGPHGLPFSTGSDSYTLTTLQAGDKRLWEETWRTIDAILSTAHQSALQHHALFIVAVLSTSEQVYPNPAARAAYQQRWQIDNLFSINQRVVEIGRRDGFEVLDLGPSLKQYADANGAYLHGYPGSIPGYGHWNALGHHVAGTLIADRLCTILTQALINKPISCELRRDVLLCGLLATERERRQQGATDSFFQPR